MPATTPDRPPPLLGLRNVHAENKTALAAALGLKGVDAIHLGSRPEGAAFLTFDQAFVKRANRAGVRDIFIAWRRPMLYFDWMVLRQPANSSQLSLPSHTHVLFSNPL